MNKITWKHRLGSARRALVDRASSWRHRIERSVPVDPPWASLSRLDELDGVGQRPHRGDV